MGKNLSGLPWLTAVKRAFRSPSKDNSIIKQEQLIGEEKKREKKIRWIFRKPIKADKREPTVRPPSREDWAAVSIQTAFRGFLARRALRALRGLVKLQALVRGYNVRKQANTALRCMQSLVRLQSQILDQRAAALEDMRRRSLEMQRIGRRHKSFGNEAESNTHFTPSPISRSKPSKVRSTSIPRYATTPNHLLLPNYMAATESAKAKAKAKARGHRQDVGLSTVRKRLSYKGDGYGVSCSSGSTPSFKVEQLSNYSSCSTVNSLVRNVSPSQSSKFINFIRK